MPVSPLVEETNVFSYTILSGGSEIPNTCEINSINITMEINMISSAEISLRDGSAAGQTFEVTDSDTFKPGTEIEIKLGYQSKNDSIFKGVVLSESISVSDGGTSLRVYCKDKSDVLTKNNETANYVKKKDSEIIESIISAAGLTADVTATTVVREEVNKPQQSDWDFICELAEKNGMVIITDAGKVTVTKPDLSTDPALQIQFGYDMLDFDTEINSADQYSGVKCSGWDIATLKRIEATASEPTVNEEGDEDGSALSEALSANVLELKSAATYQQDELQAWADATLLRIRLSRFQGSVSFHGSAKAKVNSLIKLMGLSDRFNGNSYISGIKHSVSPGNWQTTATIGMSQESFREKNSLTTPGNISSTKGALMHGLQTGIVKKINEDPDNLFRVQIQIPILGDNSEPVWARLATFYAGNQFGAYFMPEVGDEVILGFMDDVPSDPVILGSVFSKTIAAPETPDEKNTIKTLITQSKLQLKFDDENKVITVLTPGGNTVVMSDKDKGITVTDQNNNKIEMNDSGITLTDKSSNKIEMSSSGITIESQSGLTLKASQELQAQGMSVELSGDQSATLKGNSECEVSSSGQTSVKGSMVMIN
ncbi:MAG: type VI secretion system tip protein VgrG [Flavobacteriales bacterium]|nr:type VI secretion system tip protein VgrG [Flavobacteriales bacterium]